MDFFFGMLVDFEDLPLVFLFFSLFFFLFFSFLSLQRRSKEDPQMKSAHKILWFGIFDFILFFLFLSISLFLYFFIS